MLIKYQDINFRADTLTVIDQAAEIIAEYRAQGYDLTLRQLYYQMVARGLIPNNQRSYKRLGSIIADARMAGLISWRAIVDRTRNLEQNTHWDSPAQIVRAAVNGYRIDKWADQPFRPEVWVEKQALAGVMARACGPLDVPYFVCRGYPSASEVWAAGRRMMAHFDNDQTPVIIHPGDHDPSGIDMTRDIVDRLLTFAEEPVRVMRIALNMDQVDEHNPPPNPAKLTDSRAEDYISRYGDQSWELDALRPQLLRDLIEVHVAALRDDDLWDDAVAREQAGRDALREAAEGLDV